MASKLGCGPIAIIAVLIVFLVVLGGNEAVGFYYTHCDRGNSNFIECIIDELFDESDDKAAEGSVAAVGAYEYKGYSVSITLNVPLEGGAVNGTISGACDGSITGNNNGGAISGSMSGTCDPFFVKIPAGAEFTGTVNKGAKTIAVSFNGRGGGLEHAGSTTLQW